MAKDKNRDEMPKNGAVQETSAGKIQRDSIDATSGSASDSELDIHALLRKYMPDYDNDETDAEASGGILQQLKQQSADTESVSDVNHAFSAPETVKQQKRIHADDASEFEFTDELDVPSDSEDAYDDVLEDEEGIYEDEIPSPAKADKKHKTGLLKRFSNRTRKQVREELVPFSEESLETTAEKGDMTKYFSEEITSSENVEENSAVNHADAVLEKADVSAEKEKTAAVKTETDDGFDGIDLDAIAASLSMASPSEEKTDGDMEESENTPSGTAANADDDAFDPTDINLMVAFGMDEEKQTSKSIRKRARNGMSETREQRTARQVGDRLEAEQTVAHKVKLDYPEYMDRSQNAEIQKRYRYKLLTLWIKFGLCGICTVLLMLFENIEIIGKLLTGTPKQFGGVFDPAVYPVVYAMVSLQLMLLACVFAWEQIYDGIRNLFRGTPKPESMTALLTVAGILYTVVIARITVQSSEPVMFNFIAAFAAWMTLAGAIYNTKREILGFQVISSPKPKHIVCRVSDEESRCETDAFAEDEDICDVMRIEKTDFVDGFFTRLNTPDGTTTLFMSCALGIVLALSVLFGVFTGVRGGSGIEIAQSVIVSMGTLAPLSIFLGFSYPFWRASMAARDYDSAIIGETSLAEYANASIVSFDDKNVFPSYGVKVQNIRIYNNARIDRVMYYAASVFAKAGGPLQDVFEIATLEIGHSGNVSIFDTDRGFLAAEVDGVNILFGTARSLMDRGLHIPNEVCDEDADMSDELSIMYMFREDRLVAKMYIQYVMDGDIELILGQFQNSGLYVCVRTFDPNIDERMIARKVKMKRIPLKVVRNAAGENETAEKANSGLVTCGSPKSLLQVISFCDKVLHTKKTNIALYVLAILIGAAVMTLLVLSGSVSVMTSLYIAVYQLLWLIPMLLSSRMFIR